MILSQQKDYLSITNFNQIEISHFTVLTGVNGAGKSHLLKAIENKSVIVDGVMDHHIVHFNYETFRLDNEPQFNAHQITSERSGAWSMLTDTGNANIKGTIGSHKNNLGEGYISIKKICGSESKSLWDLMEDDVNDADLYEKLKQYRANVYNHFNTHRNLKNNPQASAMFVMAKKLPYSLDEISELEFNRLYEPYTFKSDFLPTQLGKVFADYYSKYEDNQYNSYRNDEYSEDHDVLSNEKFIEVHGPKPWTIVNEILLAFNSMPYTINSPEGLHRDENYQVKLIHADRPDVSPEFNELSSGERILMALVASVYKSSSDNHFPDIMLLDEVDASLHPSMIQNLLKVINDIFIKRGVKTVLVTHSPTTIALAPEDSIYIMNPSGLNRIEKKSKEEALDILTEGYATLEQGLKLFDEVAKSVISIISEGRNAQYIRKALELYGITDVDVITGAESKSGKDQLKTLYEFFTLVPHDKKVMIVWDCDAGNYSKLQTKNNTKPFVFEQNSKNTLCSKGIENLFQDSLFDGFTTTTITSMGNESVMFDGRRKKDFEDYVIGRSKKVDFERFDVFIGEVTKLKTD